MPEGYSGSNWPVCVEIVNALSSCRLHDHLLMDRGGYAAIYYNRRSTRRSTRRSARRSAEQEDLQDLNEQFSCYTAASYHTDSAPQVCFAVWWLRTLAWLCTPPAIIIERGKIGEEADACLSDLGGVWLFMSRAPWEGAERRSNPERLPCIVCVCVRLLRSDRPHASGIYKLFSNFLQ